MSRAFDNNRIAIRERGMLEIMDLALAVLRDGGMPLLAAFAVGAAPMMVLNWLLLGHLTDVPYVEADELPGRYLAMMYLLIGWQIPLASALTTLYLKDAMFVDRPRWSGLWADFRASFSQLFWYQVIKRGLFIAPALLAVAAENYGLAFFLWFLAFVPFARRPYLNEIILLERNPLSTRDKRRMTTAKRAGHVHQTVAGDLVSRWLGSLTMGALLTLAIWLAMWTVGSQLAGTWISNQAAFLHLLPLSAWTVIYFFSVVRFLAYLDLRIRREGWEVELMLRAEAARMMKHAI